jgi:hypothetical protein
MAPAPHLGTTRLRTTRSALIAVVFLFLCVVPAAAASPWLLFLLLLPLAVAAYVLRVGIDISDVGITARSVFSSRTVPWDDLAGLRVGRRGDVWLVTRSGSEVAAPVLRARDLPRLAALTGGRIDVPEPPL